MSRWVKLLNFFLAGLLFVLVAHGLNTANATPESKTPDVSTQLTGGDTVVGGNSSKALGLGFSYALGDVDLNEGRNCYVSTASGNIIFGRQKVELNPWCAALFYDANRKHEFAAKLRCGLEDIIAKYDSEPECVSDQTLQPMVVSPVMDVAQYQEDESERDERIQLLQHQLDEQRRLLEQRQRPRIVQQTEPYWTDERRAKLEALKGKE